MKPSFLCSGQVWRNKSTKDLFIIHGSPTGKNLRALNLTTFVAREWHEVPGDWAEFLCVLNGKELITDKESNELRP